MQMKKIFFYLSMISLFACNQNTADYQAQINAELKRKQDSIANVEKIKKDAVASYLNQQKQGKKDKSVENEWNYSGFIGKYPIKAQLNYGEEIHLPGTNSFGSAITGYYFYDSQKQKIPLEGLGYASGIVTLVAETTGGNETFDGEFTGGMFEDFSGTWSKGNKQFKFVLKSRE